MPMTLSKNPIMSQDKEPCNLKALLANMPDLDLPGRGPHREVDVEIGAASGYHEREDVRRRELGGDVLMAIQTLGGRLAKISNDEYRLVLPINSVELRLREGKLIKDGQRFNIAIEQFGQEHLHDNPNCPPLRVVVGRPLIRTDDADALEQSYIDNPRPRKVRNSCVFGHRPTTPCHYCAHAKLNEVTTGDYNVEPTLKQLEQLNQRNALATIAIGNIPLLTYLRNAATGQFKAASLPESTVGIYKAFLLKHYSLE